jgi:hypothetical protein
LRETLLGPVLDGLADVYIVKERLAAESSTGAAMRTDA